MTLAGFVAPFPEALRILLVPVHLTYPMRLACASFVVRAYGGNLAFGSALYRRRPEGPFVLVGELGRSNVAELEEGDTGIRAVDHRRAQGALPMPRTQSFYVALQVGTDFASTEFYSMLSGYGPHSAVWAQGLAPRFGDWPHELAARTDERPSALPYLVLRSAKGMRLFGDPTTV